MPQKVLKSVKFGTENGVGGTTWIYLMELFTDIKGILSGITLDHPWRSVA